MGRHAEVGEGKSDSVRLGMPLDVRVVYASCFGSATPATHLTSIGLCRKGSLRSGKGKGIFVLFHLISVEELPHVLATRIRGARDDSGSKIAYSRGLRSEDLEIAFVQDLILESRKCRYHHILLDGLGSSTIQEPQIESSNPFPLTTNVFPK